MLILKKLSHQKLRNVLLSSPSLLYLQCIHTVWVFSLLQSVKTNLDGANAVLSSAQTNQRSSREDYRSSAERCDSRVEQLLPGITSPCGARYSGGKKGAEQSWSVRDHYIILPVSSLSEQSRLTFTVGVWHSDYIIFPPAQKRKLCFPIQQRRK